MPCGVSIALGNPYRMSMTPQEQMESLPHSQTAMRKPTVVLASQPPSWVTRGKPGQRWSVHPGTAEHQAWKAELVQVSLYLAAWGVGRLFLVRSSMML